MEDAAMLTITAAAGEYLTRTLEKANAPLDTAIRILLKDDDALQPTLDTTRPGDETFDHGGRKVLLLDARACQYLGDSRLDVRTTDEGPKLLIVQ
jgi:hypothetical protein